MMPCATPVQSLSTPRGHQRGQRGGVVSAALLLRTLQVSRSRATYILGLSIVHQVLSVYTLLPAEQSSKLKLKL